MTINECNDLKERIEFKNKLLEEEMKELESILTPVQLARFLIFVDTSRYVRRDLFNKEKK